MLWAVSPLTMELIPPVSRRALTYRHSEFAKVSNPVGPIAYPVLTSGKKHTTLHLNAFRGEPAITEFDWAFHP